MKDAWLGKMIAKYLRENRYTQTYISRVTGIPLDKVNLSLNGEKKIHFQRIRTNMRCARCKY